MACNCGRVLVDYGEPAIVSRYGPREKGTKGKGGCLREKGTDLFLCLDLSFRLHARAALLAVLNSSPDNSRDLVHESLVARQLAPLKC